MEKTFYVDDSLLQSLTQSDFHAFRKIVDQLSPAIHGAALECFRSETLAKQFVADLFSQVWRERATFRDGNHFNSFMMSMLKELIHPYFIKALEEQIALGDKRGSQNKNMEVCKESIPDENSTP